MSNNNENFASRLSNGFNSGLMLAGAVLTAIEAAKKAYEFYESYQQTTAMQNNSNRNNCGICDSELRINSNTATDFFLFCSICSNYYHKDCHPSKVLKLKYTKKCPKCECNSLADASTVY